MLECSLDSGLTLIPQRHGSAVGRAVAHQCQLLLLREAKKVTNIKKEQTRKVNKNKKTDDIDIYRRRSGRIKNRLTRYIFFNAIPRITYKKKTRCNQSNNQTFAH